MSWVVGEFVTVIVIIVFGGLAINGFISKTPVNFWAGDEVKPEEISNIKKYNNANGIIWTAFTLPQIAAAVIMPFNSFIAAVVQALGIIVGIPAAIIVYKTIERKYRKKEKIK